jgi:dipeptidyl aminopeptidase/acylaminoacyl peptidase
MDRFAYIFRGLALFFAAILIPTALSAAEPLPLAVYGKLPDIERIALSNDGKRIAVVMTHGGERAVLLLTDKLEMLRSMRLDAAKVRSLDWVGDDHAIVVMSRTETLDPDFVQSQFEFYHAIILPVDPARNDQLIFGRDPKMITAVFGAHGVRQVDGKWTAYFTGIERERGARGYYIGNARPALYGIDVAQNRSNQIAPPGSQGTGNGWLLGPNGQPAATISIDIRTGFWSIRAPRGATLASGTAPKGDARLVALGKDATTVIYSAREREDGPTNWYEVALDGSGAPREFAKAGEFDRVYTDRTSGRLIGVRRSSRGMPEFFDPAHQNVVSQIHAAFPRMNPEMIDWTPDFSRVLVRTSGNRDSGTWYLVDMAQMRATALGYEYDAITPEHVGPVSTVAYKAQDGLDLDGILTLPPGREARNLPLVMLPHGGPHSHDTEVFDWWAQAFASRGYAVFQPNFRGSTNRDEAFMRAGFGQWGKAMQTDLSDGIAALAEKGLVDPSRACIVGASYGGYAALAGVTLQQGVYRCAVAVAPVADVGMLFNSERYDNGSTGILRRSLEEELGPRSGFDAISPRRHADRADAPIMLIHGKDDTVVPFRQTEAMASALRSANKPHEVVTLAGEDHWLSRAETRLQMLESAVAFVQKHNPAD